MQQRQKPGGVAQRRSWARALGGRLFILRASDPNIFPSLMLNSKAFRATCARSHQIDIGEPAWNSHLEINSGIDWPRAARRGPASI